MSAMSNHAAEIQLAEDAAAIDLGEYGPPTGEPVDLPAPIERPVGSVFVDQGSIYYPGWQVVEQTGERQQRVLVTFDDAADAYEYLAYIEAHA